MTVAALINVGEFFSDHYLATAFAGDLRQLKARWDREEKADKATPRQGMRRLGGTYFAHRAQAADRTAGPDAEALNTAVLSALGFTVAPHVWETERGEGVSVQVPVLHRAHNSTGTHLVAIAVPFVEAPQLILGGTDADAVHVFNPITVNGTNVAKPEAVVATLFACDDAPRWVLLVAGSALLLADRATWSEGRYVLADIDGALGRRTASDSKELDTLAAVFSADALLPDDGGAAALDELLDRSRKQAVGVSKDLSEGIRRSVELLANEVVDLLDEKQRQQRVALTSRNSPTLAADLTRQSLRWLYRVLVLLFVRGPPRAWCAAHRRPAVPRGLRAGSPA